MHVTKDDTMPMPTPAIPERVDVVILGGGLAGLSLARHLLLATDKTVLLLEKRDILPQARQKVGCIPYHTAE